MAMNREKFKALVHYICWRCSDAPEKLGATKLNKILWLSDARAFYESGESITGSRYVKRQFGPVPAAIVPVVQELEAEGIITVEDTPYYNRRKREYRVHTPASSDFLNEEQKKIVEGTIRVVCDEHTATSISDASHDHIWKAAKDGEDLPHYTIFAQPESLTDEDREWAKVQLESVAESIIAESGAAEQRRQAS
jgi:hypothetical protein